MPWTEDSIDQHCTARGIEGTAALITCTNLVAAGLMTLICVDIDVAQMYKSLNRLM